jgi:hypothetical protein
MTELLGEDLVTQVKKEAESFETKDDIPLFDSFFTNEAWWKEIKKITDKQKD